jgi:dTDP-4-dehydrorhamnose reductase
MRILLTGTAGQVGGALLPLLQKHSTVVAPSLEEFDLSQPTELPRKLDDIKPDLIVNPAAYLASKGCTRRDTSLANSSDVGRRRGKKKLRLRLTIAERS